MKRNGHGYGYGMPGLWIMTGDRDTDVSQGLLGSQVSVNSDILSQARKSEFVIGGEVK